MKAVLISIRPQWCEKIATGKKTIEVRKTAPKEVPFKAYIYCTKEKYDWLYRVDNNGRGKAQSWHGKVIGEFICDKVMFLTPLGLRGFEMREEILKSICLTNDDLNAYGGLKTLYGWRISDLKIYDKSRELSEFNRPCVSLTRNCEDCIKGKTPYTWDFDEDKGTIFCTRRLTRPPQSWQYVEEL